MHNDTRRSLDQSLKALLRTFRGERPPGYSEKDRDFLLEHLELVRSFLSEETWVQNTYGSFPDGRELFDGLHSSPSALRTARPSACCLNGAVHCAESQERINEEWAFEKDSRTMLLQGCFYGVLRNLAGGQPEAWNDDPSRTFSDVLALLGRVEEVFRGWQPDPPKEAP